MKRVSSLSAFCVSLSLASVAFAAPPADIPTSSPPRVPQSQGTDVAQPSDPQPSSGATAAPGASEANGQPPSPAVNVGAPATPGSDQPQAAPGEEGKPKPKSRPFAGSNL